MMIKEVLVICIIVSAVSAVASLVLSPIAALCWWQERPAPEEGKPILLHASLSQYSSLHVLLLQLRVL